ncbi:flagellar motor switch protein FliG [Croceicoccus sp. YJ47]|uniref:flagellar motor switch protein FliG n=1 Tax=Croceicoccus sp. YJ47 TaxID=2798724 RepID=UPI001924B90B|nr:flagellar motor switch protein FliG [Croceicoccus sp. YJ47]QQN75511.1 flagellar motor switch protein FliG [Croceicoccus sp. YJ47]
MTAVQPASLSEADRAAMIVMLLDDDSAANLLAQLEPEELERLGSHMVKLGEIESDGLESAIESFVTHADAQGFSVGDRQSHLSRVMTRAVGEVKAHGMMSRIVPTAPSRTIEIARWLTPEVLVPLLEDEHPQAIAVLLLMLDPEPAAHLLAALPKRHQSGVVERVARIGPVSSHAVAMLDELLNRRLAERFGNRTLAIGGVREAAELMNRAAGVEKHVMPAIAERDRKLASEIEAEMFRFDQLTALEPMAMGRLLREIENEVLIDALKGLDEDAREPFYAAMSARAADGVKDEIKTRGRLRRADVEKAQESIVEIARRLSESGEIMFGADGGDYV